MPVRKPKYYSIPRVGSLPKPVDYPSLENVNEVSDNGINITVDSVSDLDLEDISMDGSVSGTNSLSDFSPSHNGVQNGQFVNNSSYRQNGTLKGNSTLTKSQQVLDNAPALISINGNVAENTGKCTS